MRLFLFCAGLVFYFVAVLAFSKVGVVDPAGDIGRGLALFTLGTLFTRGATAPFLVIRGSDDPDS